MKNELTARESVLGSSAYWAEEMSIILYDALARYKKAHGGRNKALADALGISEGRVSQIMRSGDINFTIEKYADFCLKIGKIPQITLSDKNEVINHKPLPKGTVLTLAVSCSNSFKRGELSEVKRVGRNVLDDCQTIEILNDGW